MPFCFFRGFTRHSAFDFFLCPTEVAITPFPFPYHNIISVFLSLGFKEQRRGSGHIWPAASVDRVGDQLRETSIFCILGGCEYVLKVDVAVDWLLVVLVGWFLFPMVIDVSLNFGEKHPNFGRPEAHPWTPPISSKKAQVGEISDLHRCLCLKETEASSSG